MVYWWFGAQWFGFRRDPLMKWIKIRRTYSKYPDWIPKPPGPQTTKHQTTLLNWRLRRLCRGVPPLHQAGGFLRIPSRKRVQAERICPRLFWPFLFGDHAILALFGSSVLGIGDFPFSAGMQQWDQHRNHSGDCYGDHDNDHDYDHDNDDDVHGDHCRLALSSNIDQQMGMPQLPLPKSAARFLNHQQ